MALHFHSSGTCAYCVGTMLEGFWVKKQHCSIDTKYNDAELNTANLSREANHSLYDFQEAEVDTLFLTLSLWQHHMISLLVKCTQLSVALWQALFWWYTAAEIKLHRKQAIQCAVYKGANLCHNLHLKWSLQPYCGLLDYLSVRPAYNILTLCLITVGRSIQFNNADQRKTSEETNQPDHRNTETE